MASKSSAVWAIDIGNNSLKALHLSAASGTVEVIGFEHIQHGKILAGSGVTDAERDELIALSLRQFVTQNDLSKDDVAVSVPSLNSFARFVNLPPVDPKRIPEIVRFEAAQQIPFDVNDVQWDWQLMTEAGDKETKVGIFAIKNDVVNPALEHFSRENVQVSYVQMAPMALYNYMLYDRPELARSDNEATIILNIGAENTDLVIGTKSTVWQRCIPMGGNSFTKAIAEAFKLGFEKAEKLKRTAPMSKYSRQILQAMKPVFADLASEIQRSLGFFTSSNPNTKLSRIIAFGGGTKMRGLLQYLQQSLQRPIERPDSFRRLAINPDVSAAKFHENVCDFGVVYGLALQGLGLGRIESNLLPRSIARSAAWASKAKHFTVAALILLAVSLMCLARTLFDKASYNSDENKSLRRQIKSVINTAQQAKSRLEAEKNKGPGSEAIIKKEFEVFNNRDVIPLVHQTVLSTFPNEENNSEQKQLYKAFAAGDVETVSEVPRKERKQIFVTAMSVKYVDDVETARLGDTTFRKRRSKMGTVGTGDMDFIEFGFDKFGAGMGMPPPKYAPKAYDRPRLPPPGFPQGSRAGTTTEEEPEGGAGYVITVAGYSPYEHIRELMDPAGAEDDKDKWGVITRLMHLDDDIVDGNSPFELYKRAEIEHFKLETGDVDWGAQMPPGIGLEEVRFEKTKAKKEFRFRSQRRRSSDHVLIDPMTKEIISKVARLDEYGREKLDRSGNVDYEVNDHWFVLKIKLVWKDAPKKMVAGL